MLGDPPAGPRQSDALIPSPALGMYALTIIPTVGAALRMQPGENKVVLRPSRLNI